MRMRYKAWAKPLIEEHKEIASISITKLPIDFSKEYELEIGGGKGEFIVGNALQFPNKNFIVYERDISCAGCILKKILESKVNNVFLVNNMIEKDFLVWPKIKISKIYLNFSDPWPKKRHTVKRLTTNEKFNLYYEVLIPKGYVSFKTDNDDFYKFSLESIPLDKYEIIVNDIDHNEASEIKTEFELKFLSQGVKIKHILLRKI